MAADMPGKGLSWLEKKRSVTINLTITRRWKAEPRTGFCGRGSVRFYDSVAGCLYVVVRAFWPPARKTCNIRCGFSFFYRFFTKDLRYPGDAAKRVILLA
jgi:hypothetical protein